MIGAMEATIVLEAGETWTTSQRDLFETEVVGCVLVGDDGDGDGGHSGEETKQAQGPGSRIGVAIVTLVSCICVVINAHRRQT